jgi:pyruvate formate lyase activating enzyme
VNILSEVYRTNNKDNEQEGGKGVGLITNLQDFAVHDGPGLRVVVFFKGCPIRCKWCQNPINLAPFAEIEHQAALCLDCLRCLEICRTPGAITNDKQHRIDRKKCIRCMECISVCPVKALSIVGESTSVEKLTERIARYKPFFDASDHGGVTLSGGEPTFQPEFAFALLQSCKQLGIHTAIETCGYADYNTLKRIAEISNLILFDIKHMNEISHISGTGVSNGLILDNLTRLCKEVDVEIAVRIPLICGFNDDNKNITETMQFVSSLKKIKRVDLLPFNELPSEKYKALGLKWEYQELKRQPPERLAELEAIVRLYGLEGTIGGSW